MGGTGVKTFGKGELSRASENENNNCNNSNNGVKYKKNRINKEVASLRVMYFNAGSMLNKIEELKCVIKGNEPDIIGITETWLKDDVDDNEISIVGYQVFRQDRVSNVKKKGGGVMFYVRDSIKAMTMSVKDKHEFEHLWIKVKGGDSKKEDPGYIGIFYVPPDVSEKSIKGLKGCFERFRNQRYMIVGDFNFGGINWENGTCDNRSKKFFDTVNDMFLHQMVLEATRENNILDLILVKDKTFVNSVEIGCPVGRSDHNTIACNFVLRHKECNLIRKLFDYGKGNYQEIIKDLAVVNWEEVFKQGTVNEHWIVIKEKLLVLRDKYIPTKCVRKGEDAIWMNKGIKRLIQLKQKAWKRFKEGRTNTLQFKYKKLRNEVISKIREAKKSYELKLVQKAKSNRKCFYTYANKKNSKSTKNNIGPLVDGSGKEISDNKGIINELNNFFATVFTEEKNVSYPEIKIDKVFDHSIEIGDLVIEENMIRLGIKELKLNKSPGIDEINSTYLMNLGEAIVKPLTLLFKESVETGCVPDEWKKANVTPLFKKGSRSSANNYRPVSLTSQICKMLEKIIKSHMDEYLSKHELIKGSQHGFRDGKSCLSNLLEMSEYVTSLVDEGLALDILYLDFQKAFDKVPHRGLIHKLKAYGVKGNVLKWIESWLKDRLQRVCHNSESSEWMKVGSGVPQGSVLGPLLFVIFIDDIDADLNGKAMKFADDTKLISRVGRVGDDTRVRSDLDKLMAWSEKWKMPFNLDKCKVMHLGNQNPTMKYELGGKELITVEEEVDLGVMFTESFKVGKQCARAAKSANKILGLIFRTVSGRSPEVLLPLYKALVRPQMEYCMQIWRPYLKKDMLVLEKIQKRFTKRIAVCKGLKYERRLSKLGIISMEDRFIRSDLVLAYKILSGKLSKDLLGMFEMNSNSNTRGNYMKVYKKRCRLDLRKYSFSNRVVDMWNKLPDSIVQVNTVEAFKSKIGHYMSACGGST
jgi:ribonuclease P/MRP protein subunit RPP40